MFSKACEYAIKAMIYIKTYSASNRNINLIEISEAIGSPRAFTAKILHQLKKNNLLQSTIGAKGGFKIEPNKRVTINEIVLAIDGSDINNKCVLGLSVCSEVNPCPMHAQYKIIKENMLEILLNKELETFSKSIKQNKLSLK